jgi:hypothetical protein
VTVNLQTTDDTQYADIYMIYLCTKFHMPSNNGSFVSIIEPKTQQDRKYAYNITMRHVHATIVAVEK